MNKQDLIFTCTREIEYCANTHKEKSVLYGVECLLLDVACPNMGGMDCMVAYIVTANNKEKFNYDWHMYHDIEAVERECHISYNGNARDYLCEILEEHAVIIIEEQRCYLRPQTKVGADFIKKAEQDNLVKVVSKPKESDDYHMLMLPAAYESYGRVLFNYQLFMSGLQA